MKIRNFIEDNFLIDDARTGQFVPFKFNHVQDLYYKLLVNTYGESFEFSEIREMILKARKEGFTSLILAIFAAIDLLSKYAVRSLEISYKDDATAQHFRRYKNFILSFFTHDTTKWNKELDAVVFKSVNEGSELVLKENQASFYVGTASTKTGERGGTVQKVLFSEEAHYPNTGIVRASEIVDGTSSMVAVGSGMIFRETTGNGFNHYKTSWDMAKNGDLDFKTRFFGWREFYTQEQFEKICLGFSDKAMIPQEFPENEQEAFVSSGRQCFNRQRLVEMLKDCVEPLFVGRLEDDKSKINLVSEPKGILKIWKYPRHEKKYLIASDIAEGLSDGAWSVASVFDRTTWEVVAEMRGRIDPSEWGRMLCTLGEYFNFALIAPELNNHGHATIGAMNAEKYPHILTNKDLWETETTIKQGFPNNKKTNVMIRSALRNSIEEKSYKENSRVAIEEMIAASIDDSGDMINPSGWLDCVDSRMIGIYCLGFLGLDETYREGIAKTKVYIPNRFKEPEQRSKTFHGGILEGVR